MDRAKEIFNNTISCSDYAKALKGKEKFIKKFGDDSAVHYKLCAKENDILGKNFGCEELVISKGEQCDYSSDSIIIGNIRMGFGHYRISMAMASCARALGYKPYWFDLNSLEGTVCSKVIGYQNDLYSLGSRLSQKSKLFNVYWEKLNSEGFGKLSYNAKDQKSAELMAPVCASLPKNIPYVATHVWPAQAAIHAGMTNVVNAIPDNWPMALHLAQGAKHTVQTPSAYLGYKAMRGMADKPLKPMPDGSIFYTGHYIDHELVTNIETDCAMRIKRQKDGKPIRYLMTVGGAGAGTELFVEMIKYLTPNITGGRVTLMINFGDHKDVYDTICKTIPSFKTLTAEHFCDFAESARFADNAYNEDICGIHAFYDSDIYSAVYITNLLMRCSDVLITKPSELAFYPIPKIMIKRVGGHEAWGAIRSAEVGDGTYECDNIASISAMIKLMSEDTAVISQMCNSILTAKDAGIYNGAYNVIRLATQGRMPDYYVKNNQPQQKGE